MLVIPAQTGKHDYDVFIVMEQDSIQRILAHDPGEFRPSDLGLPWAGMRLGTVYLCYLGKEDGLEFEKLTSAGEMGAIAKFLARGWKHRPEVGDHDMGPQRLKGN